jgi:hypothetical protein
MTSHCEHRTADWDSLALGALPEIEAKALQAHLGTGCLTCQALYAEAAQVCLAMGASLPGQAPSQLVEDRLARYVNAVPKMQVVPLPIHSRRPVWHWLAAAAAIPFAFWLGTLWHRPGTLIPAQPIAVQAPAQTRGIEKSIEKSIDPNPALQARIAELEAQLNAPKTLAVDPRLAELTARLAEAERRLNQPAPAPQTVSVTDPELEKQLTAFRARVRDLESELDSQRRLLVESQTTQKQTVVLKARLETLESESRLQRQLLEDYRLAFRTIESSGMRQVELAGVDPAAGRGGARALYSKDGGLLVLAHDLPRLSTEKCYQLWILRKGSPSIVSGGLMKLDAQGRGYLQSPPTAALKDATGFAITDEPQGGSVVARGRKLLFGAL